MSDVEEWKPVQPAAAESATLVTGCSSGIGHAIARRVAAEGWPVFASARRRSAIEALADDGCRLLELDVTDPASRRAAVDAIEREFGHVVGLVNNAGYGQQGPFEETPLDAIRIQFETNVFGPAALCQHVLPGMRRARFGRIVNVSSMGGRLSFPGGAAYHGSKHAIEAISDVLRFEVGGLGIGVVVVEPGPTRSDFGRTSLRSLDRLVETADGDYDSLRAGIRAALESTFETPTDDARIASELGARGDSDAHRETPDAPLASTPEDVAEAVWRALSEPDPEPRVIVGEMARRLIEAKERGSPRDWDELLASMYPRPGQQTR